MKKFKNFFWMGSTTGIRLISGMALSIVLARAMGVSGFGTLMAWFAVGGLLAIPVNYGLGPLILREAVRAPDGGRSLLRQAVALKLLIAMPVSLAAVLYCLFVDGPLSILFLLFATHVIDSFVDLLGAMLRSAGQYAAETSFATVQALNQFAVIAASALIFSGVGMVAMGFLLSRVLPIIMIARLVRRNVGGTILPQFRGVQNIASLGWHYFIDNGIQTSIQFLDVILLKHFAGAVAVGNYQAGMKVATGMTQLINIIVSATLPTLSRNLQHTQVRWKNLFESVLGYAAIGAILAAPLYLYSEEISLMLFGEQYKELPQIMMLLSAFVFLRFVAAGSGVLLVALGSQRVRSFAMLVGIAVLAISSTYFMSAYGAGGAVISLTCAYLTIAIILTGMLIRIIYSATSKHGAEA